MYYRLIENIECDAANTRVAIFCKYFHYGGIFNEKDFIVMYIFIAYFSITGCMHDMPPVSTDVYVCSASGKEETALDVNGFRYVTGDLLYTVSSNQAPQKSVEEAERKMYTAFGHEFNLEYTDSYYRDFHRQAIDKYIDKVSLAEFDFFEGTDTVAYFDPGNVEIKLTEPAPVHE